MGSGNSGLFNNTKGGCFVAGTLVLTKYGMEAIENIKIGDYVFSKNLETGEMGFKRVKETFIYKVNQLIYLYCKDTLIKTTLEHLFWIQGEGWSFAEEIKEKESLTNIAEFPVYVQKIKNVISEQEILVYNLHIEDFFTYYITELNILVHNSSKKNDIYKTPTKGSGKEKSTDIPVWAKGFRPYKMKVV